MMEKKPKSPFIVVMAILFLLIFIVVPPIFRVIMPRATEDEINSNKRTILTCEKVYIDEKSRTTVRSIYVGSEAEEVTITYSGYTPTDEEIAAANQAIDPDKGNDITPAEELLAFKKIAGLNISETLSETVVTITRQNVNENPNNLDLANYMLSPDSEKQYLEKKNYSCKSVLVN